jgi:uncharacterized membrane protein
MVDRSDDAEETASVQSDDANEIVYVRSERLDAKGGSADPDKVDNSARSGEVIALQKKVRRQKNVLIVTGMTAVILFIMFLVVVSANQAIPESGTSPSTAPMSTAQTTSSSTTSRPNPATTTTTAATTTLSSPSEVSPSENSRPQGQETAPPQPWLNGQYYIPSGTHFDLDNGNQAWGRGGDIVHDGQAVSGNEGALLALGTDGPNEYSRCGPLLHEESSWRSHILFTELPAGSVLCVWTNEGRLSYLEVTRVPNSNGGDILNFRWTTWRK